MSGMLSQLLPKQYENALYKGINCYMSVIYSIIFTDIDVCILRQKFCNCECLHVAVAADACNEYVD